MKNSTVRLLATPILIGLAFGLLTLHQSEQQGQLSLPITYDDITYFNDALWRLWSFGDHGVKALLRDYITCPPHSPFSTGMAFLGFALFGVNDWAPAAANIALVIVLAIVIRMEMRGMPEWAFIAVAVVALCHPIPAFLVVESRPDVFCGLVTAYAILTMASKSWTLASPGHRVLISVLIGAATLIKPAIAPLTVALYMYMLALLSLTEWRAGQAVWSQIVRTGITSMALVLAVGLIFFAFGWHQIYDYIVATELGPNKDLWAEGGGVADRMRYYLTGSGSWLVHAWLLIMCGGWTFALIAALFTRTALDYGMLVLTGLAFLAIYIAVSIPTHRSPFIGAIVGCAFFILFLRALIFTIASLLRARKRFVLAIGLTAMIVFALYAQRSEWYTKTQQFEPDTPAIRAARKNILVDLAHAIETSSNGAGRIFVTGTAQYLNADTLRYQLHKDGYRGLETIDTSMSADAQRAFSVLSKSQFVVSFSADNNDPLAWLPGAKNIAALASSLAKSGNFRPLRIFSSPTGSGTVTLYQQYQAGRNAGGH